MYPVQRGRTILSNTLNLNMKESNKLCEQCGYQATWLIQLKQHKESKHEGVIYPCNHCNYHTTRQCDLKKHKESLHEGVKYSCNQCEYIATQKCSIEQHKKSKHEAAE